MTKENRKKSSQTAFLLYAVIWSLCVPLDGKGVSFAAEERGSALLEEDLRSLEDPFNVGMRVPELVTRFMEGLAEIKRQMEPAAKKAEEPLPLPVPKKEKVVPSFVPPPVVTPVQQVEPRMKVVPSLKVTGIVYDTILPQAIINGKVVRAGDVIEGVAIVKIQKGLIDARFEGQDVPIKFNNQ